MEAKVSPQDADVGRSQQAHRKSDRLLGASLRFARALGVIGFFCLAACAVRDGEPQTYVVQPHDTLYSIAWRHDLDYRALARWNGIGPDYRISVGQRLKLRSAPPPSETRTAKRATAATPPSAAAARGAAAPPGAAPATPAPAPHAPAPAPGRWIWPTSVLESPHAVAGGGLLLEGVLGQPVRAACGGRVVYVGNGIRGYGNLIIIKHDDSFLSAYAHAREVAVREGQEVLPGQVIAQMGIGPHQSPALYFEIRLNGKPVDPLPYLSGEK
jgi:lipoprotein NlpD